MVLYRFSAALPCTALALSFALVACSPATPPVSAPAPVSTTAPAAAAATVAPPLGTLSAHNLVPAPASVTSGTGSPFVLTATTTIVVSTGNAEGARVAEELGAMLRPSTTFRLPVSVTDGAAARGAIALRLGGPASLGAEGYELTISSDSVRLLAAGAAGLYRGVQTLRQLLPAAIESEMGLRRMALEWRIPAGRIADQPRFAWRGAMLDVARHFFSVSEVKEFIELLVLYKMNVLHLHLADDQGWRIQIDSWPKLTTVGGATEVGGGPGGFYTKQDYAEIVRYAQDRFITIVPEIDMPGHTNAAIAAYPELGCSRPTPGVHGGTQPAGVYTGTEVGWSTFCPDSAVTYRFVDDLIRELAAMTPGPYLHIGGDEVHALKDEQFIRFIEKTQDIVYKYGKTMVGWEEVGKARLRPTSIAQQWKSDSLPRAVSQGAKLLMSPATKTYLDMKYTHATELGLTWAAIIELRTAYDWDPATYVKGLKEQSIVGVEAPLWTETVKNISAAQFLTMPRLPALAEVGWSAASVRDWESFRRRIAAHAPRWRMMGVNFYPSPQVDWWNGAKPEVKVF